MKKSVWIILFVLLAFAALPALAVTDGELLSVEIVESAMPDALPAAGISGAVVGNAARSRPGRSGHPLNGRNWMPSRYFPPIPSSRLNGLPIPRVAHSELSSRTEPPFRAFMRIAVCFRSAMRRISAWRTTA